jgi:hypothetical protein
MACPRSCIGLAGASPVGASAEAPRSYSHSQEEISANEREDNGGRNRREPMSGPASDGAGRNASEAYCLVTLSKPKGREAETDMLERRQKTEPGTQRGSGLSRGIGRSTQQKFDTEVGRSSPVALQWAGRLYKARAERRRSRQEVRRGRSTEDLGRETRAGKVLYFGQAS